MCYLRQPPKHTYNITSVAASPPAFRMSVGRPRFFRRARCFRALTYWRRNMRNERAVFLERRRWRWPSLWPQGATPTLPNKNPKKQATIQSSLRSTLGKMRISISFVFAAVAVLLLATHGAEAQFFRNVFRGFNNGVSNFFRPVMQMFHSRPSFFSGGQGGRPGRPDLDETGGTKKPQSTGIDNPFPDDCGRDKKKGTGLLCFPDGKLCQESKIHIYREIG